MSKKKIIRSDSIEEDLDIAEDDYTDEDFEEEQTPPLEPVSSARKNRPPTATRRPESSSSPTRPQPTAAASTSPVPQREADSKSESPGSSDGYGDERFDDEEDTGSRQQPPVPAILVDMRQANERRTTTSESEFKLTPDESREHLTRRSDRTKSMSDDGDYDDADTFDTLFSEKDDAGHTLTQVATHLLQSSVTPDATMRSSGDSPRVSSSAVPKKARDLCAAVVRAATAVNDALAAGPSPPGAADVPVRPLLTALQDVMTSTQFSPTEASLLVLQSIPVVSSSRLSASVVSTLTDFLLTGASADSHVPSGQVDAAVAALRIAIKHHDALLDILHDDMYAAKSDTAGCGPLLQVRWAWVPQVVELVLVHYLDNKALCYAVDELSPLYAAMHLGGPAAHEALMTLSAWERVLRTIQIISVTRSSDETGRWLNFCAAVADSVESGKVRSSLRSHGHQAGSSASGASTAPIRKGLLGVISASKAKAVVDQILFRPPAPEYLRLFVELLRDILVVPATEHRLRHLLQQQQDGADASFSDATTLVALVRRVKFDVPSPSHDGALVMYVFLHVVAVRTACLWVNHPLLSTVAAMLPEVEVQFAPEQLEVVVTSDLWLGLLRQVSSAWDGASRLQRSMLAHAASLLLAAAASYYVSSAPPEASVELLSGLLTLQDAVARDGCPTLHGLLVVNDVQATLNSHFGATIDHRPAHELALRLLCVGMRVAANVVDRTSTPPPVSSSSPFQLKGSLHASKSFRDTLALSQKRHSVMLPAAASSVVAPPRSDAHAAAEEVSEATTGSSSSSDAAASTAPLWLGHASELGTALSVLNLVANNLLILLRAFTRLPTVAPEAPFVAFEDQGPVTTAEGTSGESKHASGVVASSSLSSFLSSTSPQQSSQAFVPLSVSQDLGSPWQLLPPTSLAQSHVPSRAELLLDAFSNTTSTISLLLFPTDLLRLELNKSNAPHADSNGLIGEPVHELADRALVNAALLVTFFLNDGATTFADVVPCVNDFLETVLQKLKVAILVPAARRRSSASAPAAVTSDATLAMSQHAVSHVASSLPCFSDLLHEGLSRILDAVEQFFSVAHQAHARRNIRPDDVLECSMRGTKLVELALIDAPASTKGLQAVVAVETCCGIAYRALKEWADYPEQQTAIIDPSELPNPVLQEIAQVLSSVRVLEELHERVFVQKRVSSQTLVHALSAVNLAVQRNNTLKDLVIAKQEAPRRLTLIWATLENTGVDVDLLANVPYCSAVTSVLDTLFCVAPGALQCEPSTELLRPSQRLALVELAQFCTSHALPWHVLEAGKSSVLLPLLQELCRTTTQGHRTDDSGKRASLSEAIPLLAVAGADDVNLAPNSDRAETPVSEATVATKGPDRVLLPWIGMLQQLEASSRYDLECAEAAEMANCCGAREQEEDLWCRFAHREAAAFVDNITSATLRIQALLAERSSLQEQVGQLTEDLRVRSSPPSTPNATEGLTEGGPPQREVAGADNQTGIPSDPCVDKQALVQVLEVADTRANVQRALLALTEEELHQRYALASDASFELLQAGQAFTSEVQAMWIHRQTSGALGTPENIPQDEMLPTGLSAEVAVPARKTAQQQRELPHEEMDPHRDTRRSPLSTTGMPSADETSPLTTVVPPSDALPLNFQQLMEEARAAATPLSADNAVAVMVADGRSDAVEETAAERPVGVAPDTKRVASETDSLPTYRDTAGLGNDAPSAPCSSRGTSAASLLFCLEDALAALNIVDVSREPLVLRLLIQTLCQNVRQGEPPSEASEVSAAALLHELREIRTRTVVVMHAIESREGLLDKLHDFVAKFARSPQHFSAGLTDSILVSQLADLRAASARVVEATTAWRVAQREHYGKDDRENGNNSVYAGSPLCSGLWASPTDVSLQPSMSVHSPLTPAHRTSAPTVFLYRGLNYLEKMKHDLHFLVESPLSPFVHVDVDRNVLLMPKKRVVVETLTEPECRRRNFDARLSAPKGTLPISRAAGHLDPDEFGMKELQRAVDDERAVNVWFRGLVAPERQIVPAVTTVKSGGTARFDLFRVVVPHNWRARMRESMAGSQASRPLSALAIPSGGGTPHHSAGRKIGGDRSAATPTIARSDTQTFPKRRSSHSQHFTGSAHASFHVHEQQAQDPIMSMFASLKGESTSASGERSVSRLRKKLDDIHGRVPSSADHETRLTRRHPLQRFATLEATWPSAFAAAAAQQPHSHPLPDFRPPSGSSTSRASLMGGNASGMLVPELTKVRRSSGFCAGRYSSAASLHSVPKRMAAGRPASAAPLGSASQLTGEVAATSRTKSTIPSGWTGVLVVCLAAFFYRKIRMRARERKASSKIQRWYRRCRAQADFGRVVEIALAASSRLMRWLVSLTRPDILSLFEAEPVEDEDDEERGSESEESDTGSAPSDTDNGRSGDDRTRTEVEDRAVMALHRHSTTRFRSTSALVPRYPNALQLYRFFSRAAFKIQRQFRSTKRRRTMLALIGKLVAAVKVQRWIRKQFLAACMKIVATVLRSGAHIWRWYKECVQWSQRRRDVREKRNAIRIQRWYRICCAKATLHELKRRYSASIEIQRVYRGHLGRNRAQWAMRAKVILQFVKSKLWNRTLALQLLHREITRRVRQAILRRDSMKELARLREEKRKNMRIYLRIDESRVQRRAMSRVVACYKGWTERRRLAASLEESVARSRYDESSVDESVASTMMMHSAMHHSESMRSDSSMTAAARHVSALAQQLVKEYTPIVIALQCFFRRMLAKLQLQLLRREKRVRDVYFHAWICGATLLKKYRLRCACKAAKVFLLILRRSQERREVERRRQEAHDAEVLRNQHNQATKIQSAWRMYTTRQSFFEARAQRQEWKAARDYEDYVTDRVIGVQRQIRQFLVLQHWRRILANRRTIAVRAIQNGWRAVVRRRKQLEWELQQHKVRSLAAFKIQAWYRACLTSRLVADENDGDDEDEEW